MNDFSRRLARFAVRAGLATPFRAPARSRSSTLWHAPLDESLLRRLERTSLVAQRRAAAGLGGEHRSRARAASTDFVDYRPYQAGDDFRQIDWSAYARLGQLFVRLTEARERLALVLMLDCSASMDWGEPSKFDFARQLAAVLGYVALARYDHVQLVALGEGNSETRVFRGRQSFSALLTQLDALQPTGRLTQSVMEQFRPLKSGRAVLISDLLLPEGYEAGLDTLASQGLAPSVLQVLSPDELWPTADGDVELRDVETGERLSIGMSVATLDAYRRRLRAWCEGIERACLARGLRYFQVASDQSLERVSLVGLRQAGVLA